MPVVTEPTRAPGRHFETWRASASRHCAIVLGTLAVAASVRDLKNLEVRTPQR